MQVTQVPGCPHLPGCSGALWQLPLSLQTGPGGKSPLGTIRGPGVPAAASGSSPEHKMKLGLPCLLALLCLLHLDAANVSGATTTSTHFPTTASTSFLTSDFSTSSTSTSGSGWSSSSSESQVRMPQSLIAAFLPFLWLFGELNIISRMARPEHSRRFTTPFVNCRCPENELKPG